MIGPASSTPGSVNSTTGAPDTSHESIRSLDSGSARSRRSLLEEMERAFSNRVGWSSRRPRILSPFAEAMGRADARIARSRLLATVGRFHTVDVAGVTMRLDLGEMHDAMMLRELRRDALYERPTSLCLLERIKTEDVFIDVGANNGWFSLLAATRMRKPGAVYAFEPASAAYARLKTNIQLNGFDNIVRPSPLAISSASGSAWLFESAFEDGLSSVSKVSRVCTRVPASTLDEAVKIRPASWICKIDVEGHEEEVIRGMEGLVKSASRYSLIVEWSHTYADDSLWNSMARLGRVYEIRASGSTFTLKNLLRVQDTYGIGLSNLLVSSL